MQSVAVASAAVGRDQYARCLAVFSFAHFSPPLADALHGKLGRVRTNSDVYPPCVFPNVVDAVRDGLGHLWIGKVVAQNFYGRVLSPPFRAWVFVMAHQLLFLGVNRDDGPVFAEEKLGLIVDIQELLVSIGMVFLAFRSLAICLQAVTHGAQHTSDRPVADFMPPIEKIVRQIPHALACPSQ